jgi:hypothetical protein
MDGLSEWENLSNVVDAKVVLHATYVGQCACALCCIAGWPDAIAKAP